MMELGQNEMCIYLLKELLAPAIIVEKRGPVSSDFLILQGRPGN